MQAQYLLFCHRLQEAWHHHQSRPDHTQPHRKTFPLVSGNVFRYVNRWHHYTAYHVGDERNRPAVQSPIDNLLFIGDISFVPHPAVFMEKTNVTAKWATNLLLDKIGQQEGKIEILVSGTHSATTHLLEGVGSVYLSAAES